MSSVHQQWPIPGAPGYVKLEIDGLLPSVAVVQLATVVKEIELLVAILNPTKPKPASAS